MCAIIAWHGKLPPGLLFKLLRESEHRGQDSTGLAHWSAVKKVNVSVKQAVAASYFIEHQGHLVVAAQEASHGLAHLRRASPRMPVNNDNAHPFLWQDLFLAHNGSIRNWKETRRRLVEEYEASSKLRPDDTALAAQGKFLQDATTDSMLLGPAIEHRDFTGYAGSFGLVWVRQENVYAFRSAQSLTGCKITWEKLDTDIKQTCTVVASTWDIIDKALDRFKTSKYAYDAEEIPLTEDHVYRLEPDSIVDEGAVDSPPSNFADAHSACADVHVP